MVQSGKLGQFSFLLDECEFLPPSLEKSGYNFICVEDLSLFGIVQEKLLVEKVRLKGSHNIP